MQRLIVTFVIALAFSASTLFAQSITLPPDSIQKFLCKKWEVEYAMMGGMNIGKMPGATDINYEFNKDNTFIITSNDPKQKSKGTWKYDAKKKLIKLTVPDGGNSNIISLTANQLIRVADMKNATPDDPVDIKLVYKPRQ